MKRNLLWGILRSNRTLPWIAATLVLVFAAALPQSASAQDYNSQDNQNQDDPPGRVARLGFMEGSVSFQPAGESEWVQAVPNRPMTTGDKLWADRDSRAEIQLGSSMIDLAPNTGVSFLNLDDRTVQLELSSGTVNVRVWNLDRDNVFEIDTANQAFTVYQPGRYRLDASEDGNSTVVTIREGQGESTGNGQSYTLHAGQRTIFTGTQTLNAEVEQLGGPDQFDNWSSGRERRYDQSPSARYCSRSVVGFEDLDDYGDWRPSPQYGYAWFPRVGGGWAPLPTMGTGRGLIRGDGLGLTTRAGDMLRSTVMAAGSTWADAGDGSLAHARSGLSTRRLSSHSSAAGLQSALPWIVARTARSVRAFLPRESGVCEPRQRDQHHGERHAGHQRLQHDYRQEQHHDKQRYVCESQRERRSLQRCRSAHSPVHSPFPAMRLQSTSRNVANPRCFKSGSGSRTRSGTRAERWNREPGRRAVTGDRLPSGNREGHASASTRIVCSAPAGAHAKSRTAGEPATTATAASG